MGCWNMVVYIVVVVECLDGVDMCIEFMLGVGNGIVKEMWWWWCVDVGVVLFLCDVVCL